MSCKSAIYTSNNTATAVPINGTIPLGTIIRRFGNNINLSNNGILIAGQGYYKITANVSVQAAAAGEISVALAKDGVVVPGTLASATASAASDVVNLTVVAINRLFCCGDSTDTLTFVLNATGTVNGINVTVEKL